MEASEEVLGNAGFREAPHWRSVGRIELPTEEIAPLSNMNGTTQPPPLSPKALSPIPLLPDDQPEAKEIRDPHTLIFEAKPFAFGGRADVYRATWCPRNAGTTERINVAVKVLRFSGMSQDMMQDYSKQLAKIDKRLSREMYTWENLHHKYITPFLGFMRSKNSLILGDSPFLVSPYYANGNLVLYLHNNHDNPSVDVFKLLEQAAEGLTYLHTRNPPIAHLDIKGENILINDNHEASICDFGVARVLDDITKGFYMTSNPVMTLAFASPEIVMGNDDAVGTEADVYAFAGLILQALSGKPPYWKIRNNSAKIATNVAKSILPKREDHDMVGLNDEVVDGVWALLDRCWKKAPSERPMMGEVLQQLRELHAKVTSAA
ncbi:hypothetical protein FRB99_004715 [Tulasnella sp. 403]|nr:hypothetical protein FRB99_004715 [Tulasnella sp. 403]